MITQEGEEEEEGVNLEENSPENEQAEEEVNGEGDSPFQLSVHAVHGTSSGNQTFTLTIQLGRLKGTALVDSGSSATFY